MNLSANIRDQIEQLIPRYPDKRSAALPLCHLVQQDQGYLSNEAIEWIAQKLGLQPIHIYELVTFYPMLRQRPTGRCQIKVCRTLSCALQGAYETCSVLEKELDCREGACAEDKPYALEFVECQADCALGPVVIVDQRLYGKVDPQSAKQLARHIKTDVATDESSLPQGIVSKPA